MIHVSCKHRGKGAAGLSRGGGNGWAGVQECKKVQHITAMSFESCWKWSEKAEQALYQTGLQLRPKHAQKNTQSVHNAPLFSLGVKGKAAAGCWLLVM